jgi:plasmid stabilization system protein ParE
LTARKRQLAFSPLSNEDVRGQINYLREEGGNNVSENYVLSLNRTLELLTEMPLIGRSCFFSNPKYRSLRRFSVSATFRKWIVFYTPSNDWIRVERVLHGAQDWASMFR